MEEFTYAIPIVQPTNRVHKRAAIKEFVKIASALEPIEEEFGAEVFSIPEWADYNDAYMFYHDKYKQEALYLTSQGLKYFTIDTHHFERNYKPIETL